MANQSINLHNINEYYVNEQNEVEITLERVGSQGNYYWYVGKSYFNATRSNSWLFKAMSNSPTTDVQNTQRGVAKKYYFYLVSDVNRLAAGKTEFCVTAEDCANILQVRMDVQIVVIIDDDASINELMKRNNILQHNQYTGLQSNENGCVTFQLPEPTFSVDSNTDIAYLISYSVGNERYKRVQKAICPQFDSRFPTWANVRNLGIELYVDEDKTDSLRSQLVTLDVYAVRVTDVQNLPVPYTSLMNLFY